MKVTDDELVQLILKAEDMSEEQFVSVYQNEASVPAICNVSDCHALFENMEPDVAGDDCNHCKGEGTVNGAFVLMGVI